MMENNERRIEKRLRYSWPVWFAENYNDLLTQGQMIDISSTGAAFSCYADRCPWPGQQITARFSVPKYDQDNSFDLENFIRDGHICRIDEISPFVRRVAIQFADPLPFRPGETETDADADETMQRADEPSEDAMSPDAAPEPAAIC
ncbi:MAG: PilZ domain-containing protein [Phycisphaerae bacterium]|nr:PilZ domain-containing protein [Phycisphaerae bacterium]